MSAVYYRAITCSSIHPLDELVMKTSDTSLFDIMMMDRCLYLASSGCFGVRANPLVGAILVKDKKIIGTGYHSRFGGLHAEREAIARTPATLVRGSTLYVNLEPCCHSGKTPPCTDVIISSGIARVVIGTRDPFHRVNGLGIAALRGSGIEVVEGVLEEPSITINRRFLTAHTCARPYIILKWAQTSDNFIARTDYSSQWISGSDARAEVHRWRAQEQGIAVGYRTAWYDNPHLTARLSGTEGTINQPVRIVFDAKGTLPQTHHVFNKEASLIRFGDRDYPGGITLPTGSEQEKLIYALTYLCNQGITSLLVEGGNALLTKLIQYNLWDEARVFTARNKHFNQGIRAPILPREAALGETLTFDHDLLNIYRNKA
jgi:diaminohydroxyphosphoribosylaminopyrimidine deaminase/5-amino-6-(5-phosphoribosylamino)uracil reductase